MDKDMKHLAKITLDNLTSGAILPTEKEIIQAMVNAILKEQELSEQLYKSYLGDRKKFHAFAHEISGIFYDKVHENV